MKNDIDFDTAEAIGKAIAKELQLKHDIDHPDRYPLLNGTKTDCGLARTIARIFNENGVDLCQNSTSG